MTGFHYYDVIMGAIASQITSLTIVYSTVYSDADERRHQSSASLTFVRWIHRGPVNSPHKWPVTRIMFPLDDVITWCHSLVALTMRASVSVSLPQINDSHIVRFPSGLMLRGVADVTFMATVFLEKYQSISSVLYFWIAIRYVFSWEQELIWYLWQISMIYLFN